MGYLGLTSGEKNQYT